MYWSCASLTHRGVRRRCNEDAVFARPELGLWAVADGMGGHSAGEVASRAIVDALASIDERIPVASMVDRVEALLRQVNDQLRDHAERYCDGRTVGSTVAALLAEAGTGIVLWAGDSRVYRLRDGELVQITRDHNPVAELLDDGLITESTALKAETNVITRAVGGQPSLGLDIILFDIMAGDTYLLCSDGLYRELSNEEIAAWLLRPQVDEAADGMLADCLERGARDNVSLVVTRAARGDE